METVRIKIKSPSAGHADLEMECSTGETVLQLKRKISEQFPTKPAAAAQKLVYSGKILRDGDKLVELLRFEDGVTVFTFHLVCSIPQQAYPDTPPATPAGLRHRGATASVPTPAAAPVQDQDMEQMMREFSEQYSAAMASLPASPSAEEVAGLQQLYSQYLSLYMAWLQQAGPGLQNTAVLQTHQFQPAVADLQAGVAAAPQQPGGAGEAGPNAALVMQAGGPGAAGQMAEAERGGAGRDVLDWVYVMTRLLLLFSVIYFHSSFLRLAFVAGLGFLVYLYQNRVLGRPRAPPPARPPQQQQQQGDGEREDDVEDGESDAEGGEQIEEQPGKLALIATFFTSLVSSIIPEQPQVV